MDATFDDDWAFSLEEIKEAYQEMTEMGWDMSKSKKWDFYFLSDSLEALWEIAELLQSHGYTLEFIGEGEEEDEKLLNVSLVKALKTPQAFFDFEDNLQCLVANVNENVQYDGWDAEEEEEKK